MTFIAILSRRLRAISAIPSGAAGSRRGSRFSIAFGRRAAQVQSHCLQSSIFHPEYHRPTLRASLQGMRGYFRRLPLLKTVGRFLPIVGRTFDDNTADKGAPLAELANKNGLCLLRYQYVKGTPAKPPKRILLEFGVCCDIKESLRIMSPGTDNSLILEISPGIPSDEHRALCRDFYLYY